MEPSEDRDRTQSWDLPELHGEPKAVTDKAALSFQKQDVAARASVPVPAHTDVLLVFPGLFHSRLAIPSSTAPAFPGHALSVSSAADSLCPNTGGT